MHFRIVFSAVCALILLSQMAFAGTPEENKELVVSFIDAANSQDFERLPSYITENFTRHSQASPSIVVKNKGQFKSHMREGLEIFPDARHDIKQIISEGDRVAIWANYVGTYKGKGQSEGLDGPKVNIETAAIFRIEGGKIAEMWVTWDNQAVKSQLEAQKKSNK